MAQVRFIKDVTQPPNRMKYKNKLGVFSSQVLDIHVTTKYQSIILTSELHSQPSQVICAWTAPILQFVLIYCKFR